MPRHEITLSYFDETSQVYKEVTLPGDTDTASVAVEFVNFLRGLGRAIRCGTDTDQDHTAVSILCVKS